MNTSNNKKEENKVTVDKYIVQSSKRILVKAISYRIFMFILTLVVTYYFLKDNKIALKYTIIMEFITFLFYYSHEIIWNAIKFGYETQKVIEDKDEKVIQVKKDAVNKINGD